MNAFSSSDEIFPKFGQSARCSSEMQSRAHAIVIAIRIDAIQFSHENFILLIRIHYVECAMAANVITQTSYTTYMMQRALPDDASMWYLFRNRILG